MERVAAQTVDYHSLGPRSLHDPIRDCSAAACAVVLGAAATFSESGSLLGQRAREEVKRCVFILKGNTLPGIDHRTTHCVDRLTSYPTMDLRVSRCGKRANKGSWWEGE